MKYCGKKSLSSIILLGLKIIWYFSLFLLVSIILVLFVIGILNTKFIPNQKVGIYELQESLLYVTFPARMVNISIKSHLLISLGLWVLPSLVGFTLTVFYLKKIFRNLANGSIFIVENAMSIKKLGYVTFGWGFLKSFCHMILSSYLVRYISVVEINISARGFILPIHFIITSILFFVLSKTFEYIVNQQSSTSKYEVTQNV